MYGAVRVPPAGRRRHRAGSSSGGCARSGGGYRRVVTDPKPSPVADPDPTSSDRAVVDALELIGQGVAGDRQWALLDANGKLCSAKRYSRLFEAVGHDDGSLSFPGHDHVRDDALRDAAAAAVTFELAERIKSRNFRV